MPPSRFSGPIPTEGGTWLVGPMGHVFAQSWSTYDCAPFRSLCLYSEVWGPNYKKQGDSPRTLGGRDCLAAVSFLSPLGGQIGLGGEAPGSRPVHWPSDRTGTDKGWYPRHCQTQRRQSLSPLGRVSGLGRGRFYFLVVRTAAGK